MKTPILLVLICLAIGIQLPAQEVGPLLNTKWDQSGLYNDLCPPSPPTCGNSKDEQLYAGCVAVAMAQIMKKYEHPSTGLGSHSYTDPANEPSILYLCHIPRQKRSVNFNVALNWQQMPSILGSSSSSSQKTSVQNLILLSGIGSEMDYGTDGSKTIGSSSNIDKAMDALKFFFRYDPNTMKKVVRGTDKKAWEKTLMDELKAERVIYYRGTDSKGESGHAWVCDGYKITPAGVRFHMNWGWGGQFSDEWFDLNDLTPDTHNFNYNNAIIIGIQPLKAVVTTPVPTNVQATDGTIPDRIRITWSGQSGNYFRVFRSLSGSSTTAVPISNWQNTLRFDDLTAPAGIPFYYFVKSASDVSGNNVSDFSTPNSGYLAAVVDLRLNTQLSVSPNPIRQNQAVSVSVALRNLGNAVFQGEIACSLHNLNSSTPLGDIEVKPLTLAANSTQNLTFSKSSITSAPGTYQLYLKQKSTGGTWSPINANGFSNPLTITITGPTAVPKNVAATQGTFTDKVVISWDGSSDAFYRVHRNTSNSIAGAIALSGWQSGRTFNDLNATPGQTYYYFVAAASSSSGSNPSVPSVIASGFRAVGLSLSASEYRATATASSGSINITSSAAWTAKSDQVWCTVNTPSGSGGSAAMLLRFSWTANTSSLSRPATITVSAGSTTKTLTVIQPGGARPANDEPCNSISITPSASGNFITANNVGATTSTNPGASTACGAVQNDVWFSFIVPASGSYTIVTKAGTLTDAVLAVYVNSCTGLSGGTSTSTCKDNNNNGTKMPVHPIGTTSLVGKQIHVRVWGKNGATGTFSIGVLNRYDETTYNLTDGGDITTLSVTVPPLEDVTEVDKASHNYNGARDLLKISPNPATDALNVHFTSKINDKVLISIMDMSGKLCLHKDFSTIKGDNLITLDIGWLPNGTYTVAANVNEATFTQRLLIVR